MKLDKEVRDRLTAVYEQLELRGWDVSTFEGAMGELKDIITNGEDITTIEEMCRHKQNVERE